MLLWLNGSKSLHPGCKLLRKGQKRVLAANKYPCFLRRMFSGTESWTASGSSVWTRLSKQRTYISALKDLTHVHSCKTVVVKRVFFSAQTIRIKAAGEGGKAKIRREKGGSGWVSKEERLRGCVRRLLWCKKRNRRVHSGVEEGQRGRTVQQLSRLIKPICLHMTQFRRADWLTIERKLTCTCWSI